MELNNLIEEYRETFVSSCNKMLDINYEVLARSNADTSYEMGEELVADTKKSIILYEDVRKKLIERKDLSKMDIGILQIVVKGTSVSMATHSIKLKKTAEKLDDIFDKLRQLNKDFDN